MVYDGGNSNSVNSFSSGLSFSAGTAISVTSFTVTPASYAPSAVTSYTFAVQVPTVLRDGDVINIMKQTDVQFPGIIDCQGQGTLDCRAAWSIVNVVLQILVDFDGSAEGSAAAGSTISFVIPGFEIGRAHV